MINYKAFYNLYFKIGSPADLVNVRMQNDTKLPVEQRRNYKHCFEALHRIFKNEGFDGLFKGTVKWFD